MKKKKLGVVLFSGRKNCIFTRKIKKFIKKKSDKFYYIESTKIGEKLPKSITKISFDYIFLFRSFFLLKKNFLNRVKKKAINIHPSPPKYRGAGGINYTLFEKSNFFGSTAHIINEKIDSGPIIDFKKFRIKKIKKIEKILFKTYIVSTKQIFFIINQILKDQNNLNKLIKKNKKIKWSKKFHSIKKLNNFYQIDKNIKKKDLIKKIKATNTSKFKPYILLHGKKFILE